MQGPGRISGREDRRQKTEDRWLTDTGNSANEYFSYYRVICINFTFDFLIRDEMKKVLFGLNFLFFLMMIISGCDKENTTSGISGSITGSSDCKSIKSTGLTDIADTLSCVDYLYDSTSRELSVIHINSGFNCCPGKLSCGITTNQDTIFVREYEKKAACDCDCLYDLFISIKGVEPDVYVMKFIEPYADGMEELVFTVDLTAEISGSYCVVRKNYPWGI